MVLHQHDPRLALLLLKKRVGLAADGLRQFQAGIGEGDEDRGGGATDDFVGAHAVFGEIGGAGRTEDLIDSDGVGVAGEFDAGQG